MSAHAAVPLCRRGVSVDAAAAAPPGARRLLHLLARASRHRLPGLQQRGGRLPLLKPRRRQPTVLNGRAAGLCRARYCNARLGKSAGGVTSLMVLNSLHIFAGRPKDGHVHTHVVVRARPDGQRRHVVRLQHRLCAAGRGAVQRRGGACTACFNVLSKPSASRTTCMLQGGLDIRSVCKTMLQPGTPVNNLAGALPFFNMTKCDLYVCFCCSYCKAVCGWRLHGQQLLRLHHSAARNDGQPQRAGVFTYDGDSINNLTYFSIIFRVWVCVSGSGKHAPSLATIRYGTPLS